MRPGSIRTFFKVLYFVLFFVLFCVTAFISTNEEPLHTRVSQLLAGETFLRKYVCKYIVITSFKT